MPRTYKVNDSFDMIGAFWSAPTPDEKFTGTLVSKNGQVSLTTAPEYGKAYLTKGEKALLTSSPPETFSKYESICGFTDKGDCSLLAAILVNKGGLADYPSNRKVSSLTYRLWAAVMGIHIDSPDAKCIESAAFYFTKIRQALPTPWSVTLEQDGNTFVAPAQALNVFKFISASLGAEIICEAFAGGGTKLRREALIKSVPRVRVTPDHPQSVEWFNIIALRLENFFALILGTSVSLKRFQVFKNDIAGWVVQNLGTGKEQKFNHQLWIKCDGSVLSSALDKWLSVPEQKRPVEKTLLGMLRKSSVFVETEFLSLAQALEGFNRLQEGRSKSFGVRLGEIHDMLSPDFASNLIGDREEFIRKVRDTRNFFTHLGGSPNANVVQELRALADLNQRLHALLRCVMLIQLGIDETLLREPILYQSTRYKWY